MKNVIVSGALLMFSAMSFSSIAAELQNWTLDTLIQVAIKSDPWLQAKNQQQISFKQREVAADALPNTSLSLTLGNLPTDSWQFNQEAMTQMKVSIAQPFTRGDSAQINAEIYGLKGQQQVVLQQVRKKQITNAITQLWLDAYLLQQKIALIDSDTHLFEQMIQIAEAGYSSGVKSSGQQDVIRAQVELTQLQERKLNLTQQFEEKLILVGEWLHLSSTDLNMDEIARVRFNQPPSLAVSLSQNINYSDNELYRLLESHPEILVMQYDVDTAVKKVSLSEQKYKPQWQLISSYGYRQDMDNGVERADLFSIGVGVNIPLFNQSSLSQYVKSERSQASAIEMQKTLKLRTLVSAVQQHLAAEKRLQQRAKLYGDTLLKQLNKQAEIALSSYTNDDGDFADVVKARVMELNHKMTAIELSVKRQKHTAMAQYYLGNNENTLTSSTKNSES
jgi:outer membrane protein TolC